MAKFELKIYNMETEEVEKVCKRNFIPVDLFIRFQQLSEKLLSKKIIKDDELFKSLEVLFLETFSGLTSEEYKSKTDTAEVLAMFQSILDKATSIETGSSKN